MARPRRTFGSLSSGHQKRLLGYYSRHGNLTRAQVVSRYNRGTLNLTAARGHAETPEHGLTDVKRNPDKYQGYLSRWFGKPSSEDATGRSREELINAVDRLAHQYFGNYSKWNAYHFRENLQDSRWTKEQLAAALELDEDSWRDLASIAGKEANAIRRAQKENRPLPDHPNFTKYGHLLYH